MPRESITLTLTERQAHALRSLAAAEDLPPEIYASEVLVKHLYHFYTAETGRKTEARRRDQSPDDH